MTRTNMNWSTLFKHGSVVYIQTMGNVQLQNSNKMKHPLISYTLET